MSSMNNYRHQRARSSVSPGQQRAVRSPCSGSTLFGSNAPMAAIHPAEGLETAPETATHDPSFPLPSDIGASDVKNATLVYVTSSNGSVVPVPVSTFMHYYNKVQQSHSVHSLEIARLSLPSSPRPNLTRSTGRSLQSALPTLLEGHGPLDKLRRHMDSLQHADPSQLATLLSSTEMFHKAARVCIENDELCQMIDGRARSANASPSPPRPDTLCPSPRTMLSGQAGSRGSPRRSPGMAPKTFISVPPLGYSAPAVHIRTMDEL
ncbi:hypothetical protein J8273_3748 [Carpediemonas membranifera]|uniref:Uncharacterized protein n=1 Tax=Carpediemonas membranifera TaxID=201153 RepID=A0A8J6B886_9EUKA|nr:hypothetical protein J8273_3748 [Carpediemonas membranifera]|eukprot:KAG9394772.1 hypothetical protein J8273_3748 [Carpediemonas membranifera]